MSNSNVTKLRISLNFSNLKVQDLIPWGCTVFTSISAAPDLFTSPPVPLSTLKQDLDNLTASVAAALDGGRKDIARRNTDRLRLEHDLSFLAAYALKQADGDPAVVTAAGFVPAPPRTHSAPQPLAQPTVASIEQGYSGQLLVSVTPVKAHCYYLSYAPFISGVPTGDWTTLTVTAARHPILITGLTPGTIYGFRVRALGRLGHTDWSDFATRMVI